ncbi:amino acid adenylation domain-containing protein [Alteromonadaceae bacterium Bs31]|nr:amino acid adenylation domain-containing protein [Alteromonadaceae bacterium Bs31]
MPLNKRYAISEIQKQFWLLDQQGKGPAYLVVSAFRCNELDIDRFISCLEGITREIPAFNVRFEADDTGVYQMPDSHCIQKITEICSDETEALSYLQKHSYQEMSLAMGPLVRLVHVALKGTTLSYISIVVHHIIIDLHSKNLLADLISEAYNGMPEVAQALGSDKALSYSNWQKHWLQGASSLKAVEYWKSKLANIDRKIELAETGSGEYFEQDLRLSASLTADIRVYCKEHKSDEFIVLLAAYYYLLAKYSGQKQFALAVPLSNRKQAEFKNSLSCFVNTLPLTVSLADALCFSDILRATRKALLGAHRHQELPATLITKSVSSSGLERQLYNIGYTFEAPMQLNLLGVQCKALHLGGVQAQLDGFLRLWKTEHTITGQLECDGHFWPKAMAQRFVKSYISLLEQIATKRMDTLSHLDICPLDDQQKLQQFNDSSTNFDREDLSSLTLPGLFAQQLQRSPDTEAVIFGDTTLTYKQFDQLTNQCANMLLSQGAKRRAVIAVYCTRSVEMLVAIYGVIKAGCAYLPIDTDLPGERVKTILLRAEASHCIYTKVKEPEDTANSKAIQFSLDTLRCYPSTLDPLKIDPDDPAYVIFTSGSTGEPKGVVNRHAGIVNRLLWMQTYLHLSEGERVLQKTPYSFDVSVWELFWPLQVGATLVIAQADSHKDPYKIAEQMRRYSIAITHFVPSMLSLFLEANQDAGSKLRAVVCSGEELSQPQEEQFFSCYPGVALHNLYGPTEAAVDVTYWQCKNDQRKHLPIGAPVANTPLYVVDENAKLAPIGIIGELWIGGVQVAQGYINDQARTTERFIENPFDAGKVYRTGDYARWTDEGVLEYIGRKDFQIKINGLRIELGDIESALIAQEAISNAAVVIQQEGELKHLVAYFTPSGEQEVEVSQLREQLSKCLPTYMVPRYFRNLDTMPLGSSGKIQRSALPKIDLSTIKPDKTALPKGDSYNLLMNEWRELLHCETLDPDKSFFDLGGDSFMLMTLFNRLHANFPHLKSVDLFRYNTVSALSSYLEGKPVTKIPLDDDRSSRMRAALDTGFSAPSAKRRKMR